MKGAVPYTRTGSGHSFVVVIHGWMVLVNRSMSWDTYKIEVCRFIRDISYVISLASIH